MFHKHKIQFYGSGKIGEKGQIVIPSKARQKLSILPGDNFIFFGHRNIIHIIKVSEIDNILDRITKKFGQNISDIKNKIKKVKGK